MFCDCSFLWAFSLSMRVFPQHFQKRMENARLVVPTPSDVEIESWDARPQRPKLDLDRTEKIGSNCRSQHPVLPEFGRFRWRTVVPPDLFSRPSPQLAHLEHRQRAWWPPTVPTGNLNFRRITGALRIRRAQFLQLPPALHIPIPP